MVRGYRPAGNFRTFRLLAAPLGHYFDVMTHGYGAMRDYTAQVSPEDHWAVAAYIRALQLSQTAKPADVPAGVEPKPGGYRRPDGFARRKFCRSWPLPATAKNADSVNPQTSALQSKTGKI